ncbi:MAG: NGG1p interacting factor NIF3 [Gammaproteobacteria bacterium]|nr:NGG1p interacting factor NIF3 [Gammaproteobacteria bacterium]
MYKIVFYVPETHKEPVKIAMFEQGAGRYQGYDCCAWETKGIGQFRPLAGSQPFIGSSNQLQQVDEFRVEMMCSEQHIKATLNALIATHPYEVPAYEVWPVKTLDDF